MQDDEQGVETSKPPFDPEPFLPPVQPPDEPDEDYRQRLIDLIAEIDRTKRDIKGQIHSHAITAKAERVSVNQVWLRRAKDKMDHLTREREEIRKVLHDVNERIKEAHRAENLQKPRDPMPFNAAFRQVARERLPPDLYHELEAAASERLKGRVAHTVT